MGKQRPLTSPMDTASRVPAPVPNDVLCVGLILVEDDELPVGAHRGSPVSHQGVVPALHDLRDLPGDVAVLRGEQPAQEHPAEQQRPEAGERVADGRLLGVLIALDAVLGKVDAPAEGTPAGRTCEGQEEVLVGDAARALGAGPVEEVDLIDGRVQWIAHVDAAAESRVVHLDSLIRQRDHRVARNCVPQDVPALEVFPEAGDIFDPLHSGNLQPLRDLASPIDCTHLL
mmetsp:Transcript_53532/g.156033  ORF Transcript_53532/g.156033 Transcript_53532/m.156033 type:complete len:229 (-) Transcript_53532:1759-2445(-)